MKEIFISSKDNTKRIVVTDNGNILEKYEENEKSKRLEGKIYLGKVQNVLQGMQAAFIDIGETRNTFIHLKDILPKVDIIKNENNLNQEKNIKKLVKVGDKILIQVKRDATNMKGAKVSTHINLPSRYFVLMPNTDIKTISQKIENDEEKNRLMEIINEILPEGFGIIVRTSALNKEKEELKNDLNETINKWKEIEKIANDKETTYPRVVYEGQSFIETLLMDLIDKDMTRIVVDNKKCYKEVEKIIKNLNEDITIELKENEDIFDIYDINDQLEKIKQRKIWLKCGGFITIDKTEALTAIDVNSGKYIGNKNLEQTVFKVNSEASVEIAKQLRLRDIGGIIIIDYIDMTDEEHKKQIIKVLEENLKYDRSKTQIVGFSKLNLLEMTRKHMKGGE